MFKPDNAARPAPPANNAPGFFIKEVIRFDAPLKGPVPFKPLGNAFANAASPIEAFNFFSASDAVVTGSGFTPTY